jgi:hypothetical protein
LSAGFHALPGKSDHEYTDVFNRPITVIAHSTLHVSSHTSHYAARHGTDETAVILASIQVAAAAGLFKE